MVILGLTGSIAMGKSTAAAAFRRLHIPVYDADHAVHELLAKGGAGVAPVADAFPSALVGGRIERHLLGAIVFNDTSALSKLEGILHPLARLAEDKFLRWQSARRARLIVLDIPLLFESCGERRCDAVIVVSAPSFLQAQRVLARPGMTRERLQGILARQTPDHAKRRWADFVVATGLGKRHSLRQLVHIIRLMRGRHGRHWPPRPRARLA
jgi:dephospho-CoA kinase